MQAGSQQFSAARFRGNATSVPTCCERNRHCALGMDYLLTDRAVGNLSAVDFSRTVVESSYFSLQQQLKRDCFPQNCHHGASVNCLSLESELNQYLLSGCGDSSLKIWDIQSQLSCDVDGEDEPRSTFDLIATVPRKSAHDFGISAIQWWPFDAGLFISGSFDHTVKVWDTVSLQSVHSFDLNCRIYDIDICSNSETVERQSLVAVASDHPFIRLLDLRSASSAHTLSGHKQRTLCVKWHPLNPFLLCSGGYDSECKVWDVRRSKSCLCRLDMLKTNADTHDAGDNLTRASVKAHLAPVNGIEWDASGTTLFTTGNDDKIRVWDCTTTEPPPLNELVNFGPLTRNKNPQRLTFVLGAYGESELQHLLFPSDNSDIFVFRTVDGKLVSRLSRTGPQRGCRTTSMARGGPHTNSFFCGTTDGEIIHWSPKTLYC